MVDLKNKKECKGFKYITLNSYGIFFKSVSSIFRGVEILLNVKNFSIILAVIFITTNYVRGAGELDYELIKRQFSSIRIIPYDKSSYYEENGDVKGDIEPMVRPFNLAQYSTHSEKRGYGKVFVYNNDVIWGDIDEPLSHSSILIDLYKYKKKYVANSTNGQRNALFVRIDFVSEDCSTSFIRFSDVFLSGSYEQSKQSLRDIVRRYYPMDSFIDQTALKHFMPSACANKYVQDYPQIRDYCLPRLPEILEERHLDQTDVYRDGLFKLNSTHKLFPLSSNKILFRGDVSGELSRELGTEMFNKLNSDKNKAALNKALFHVGLLKSVKERLRSEDGSEIDDETASALFGQTAAELLEKQEERIGVRFNQSEQAFISALSEGRVTEEFGTPIEGTKYNVKIKLYSYLDVCFYCRGTFSRMLSNNKLNEYLNKSIFSDAQEVQMNCIGNITIEAHSIEREIY